MVGADAGHQAPGIEAPPSSSRPPPRNRLELRLLTCDYRRSREYPRPIGGPRSIRAEHRDAPRLTWRPFAPNSRLLATNIMSNSPSCRGIFAGSDESTKLSSWPPCHGVGTSIGIRAAIL
jgi:hypothetical protein